MGKFFKINVLSIQLKKEMEVEISLPTHSDEMLKASQIDKESMRPLPSFEAFVQGLKAMNSEPPKTQKVHLIVAPTGSGKSSVFINALSQHINKVAQQNAQKNPKNLIVLCLPRRLACKISDYLHSQYGLNVAVKHGGVKETVGELVRPNTHVLIMTYRSAVNMILSENQPSNRQLSLIFDECHESCSEAVMLYRLFNSLFFDKPDWLHSLFCVSATMDPVELSKRLNIEPRFIHVSKIEAPRKTFTIGPKEVIPINVFEDDEDKAKKPLQKKGKGKAKKTEDDEEETKKPPQKKGKGKGKKTEDDEDGEKPKPVLNPKESMQGFARKYQEKFIHLVVEDIITAPKPINESTVVIADGVNSANTIIASLKESFSQSKVINVRFWNTFVQQECPVKDLTKCHLVIIGSHAKLSSSITFPRCRELHISDIKQVAKQDGRDATVQLFRDLVPKSVLEQCFGRANRDVGTRTRYYQAIFPSDFKITRLEYPKQDEVSDFILEYIDVSISRTPAKTHKFCSHYDLNIRQAEEIFLSQLPVELLLALHRYAKTEASKEKKEDFLKSLNILRALAHTVAFFSDDDHRFVKPTSLAHMSNGNFAQFVGIFVLHMLNKVCGCPTEQQDSEWESRLGVSHKTINELVLKIKISISKDGLGPFACNSRKEQISPAVIVDAIMFARMYEVNLLPFFLKYNPEFIFPTATDDDVLPEDQLDKVDLEGFSILPYGMLKSAGEAYISPSFIISLGSISKQPQQPQCASGGSAKPQPQCARGGSAKPQPQPQCVSSGSAQQQCARGGSAQQQCARGGSAKPQPQPQCVSSGSAQQQCARGGSAQQHSVRCGGSAQQQCASDGSAQQQCASGGSAKPHPQQQQCASGGSAQPHSVRCGHKK